MSSSDQQAARQYRLKVQLEAAMKPKLLTLFRKIARAYRASIAKTGVPQDAAQYRPQFDALIQAQDKRVQAAFSARALRGTKAAETEPEDDGAEEALLLLLLLWREGRAAEASAAITRTNEREMVEALEDARSQLQAEYAAAVEAGNAGAPPSNREVAVLAGVLLMRRFNVRVPLIALVETQAAAESTKYLEADHAIEGRPRKRWATIGDRLVRTTHAEANGQTVDFDTPFIVGGSQLRYPGDSSLGAPAAEVMNCRCAALYTEG